jgi:enoyl-CoA hydratase/carnithine racemase
LFSKPAHNHFNIMDYSRYNTLAVSRRGPDSTVLDIQMRAINGKLPTAGHEGHRELAQIWRDVGADETVRCAVLRGEGQGFPAAATWRWSRHGRQFRSAHASGRKRATSSTT